MMSDVNINQAARSERAGFSDNDGVDLLAMTELLPVVIIPLTELAGGFDLRQAGADSAHIRLLAEAASDSKLPPILVQRSSSRVIDGMHRVAAAKLCGEWGVSARLVDCGDAEALVLAMRSNTAHGLPLSPADRLAGARNILTAHPDWSDRTVAMITGVSAKTVASVRASANVPQQPSGKRLGRDGRRRPVHTLEGRRRAAEYMNVHPEASLREVARATDVSLGTVHDVKERLRRGADHDVLPDGTASRESRPAPPQQDPPIRKRPTASGAEQLAWPVIMAKLAGDPTLRYTDGGRAFLRWMTQHAMHPEEWREFTAAVPEYWLMDVSRVAAAMSEEWRQFSCLLKSRQEEAS